MLLLLIRCGKLGGGLVAGAHLPAPSHRVNHGRWITRFWVSLLKLLSKLANFQVLFAWCITNLINLARSCFAGYHPDALFRIGGRHICAKYNRLSCSQPGNHSRRSRRDGELVEQHHICSYVLFCTRRLCGKRY